MKFALTALLFACGPGDKSPLNDTAGADSGGSDDTGHGQLEDLDGDGFPSWQGTTDPARADCDDDDPAVTPSTERFVAAGAFYRGWSEALAGSPWDDMDPQREITLSPYCLDRLEVSNTDFIAFLSELADAGSPNQDAEGNLLYDFEDDDDTVPEGIQIEGEGYRLREGYEDHPVTEVTFWGARAYCESLGLSLPTEAQWEKGARGTEELHHWPWGTDEPSCDHANIRLGQEGDPEVEVCVDDTVPVGSYPAGASPYGNLDLAGNVAEWVSDWLDHDHYETSPDIDPTGPAEGIADPLTNGELARISRGGSFASSLDTNRVYVRYPEPESATSNGLGFRCARPL